MGDLFLGMDEGQGSMLVLLDILVSLIVLIKEFSEHHRGPSKRGSLQSCLLDRQQSQYCSLTFAPFCAQTSPEHQEM